MIAFLAALAPHGRKALILGLVAGFALPGLAQAMKPALPAMVAGLIFVSALRIGMKAAVGNLAQAGDSLRRVLAMQIAVPLVAVAVFWVVPVPAPVAIALILAMCGCSISGGPTFSVMLGFDPAPAMRLLILGTALLPLTILPIFWLTPALGSPTEVIVAALRLTVVIGACVAAAFWVRRQFFPDPAPQTVAALDSLAALSLAVIVVGLMSAVGPTLRNDPTALIGWLALAFAVNYGQQIASYLLLRGQEDAAQVSIVAGNRNIALFLVALPTGITDQILIFIGCYQVPMYLTPVVMKALYGRS